jgi:hypothetical protein
VSIIFVYVPVTVLDSQDKNISHSFCSSHSLDWGKKIQTKQTIQKRAAVFSVYKVLATADSV